MIQPIRFAMLFLVALVCNASAQTPAINASPTGNLLFRVRMISLPMGNANELLNDPSLKSNASGILAKLDQLVAQKRAKVVGNPVVVGKPGVVIKSDGIAHFEINPLLDRDGKTVTFMMALDYHGGGNLRYDSKIEVGSSVFAGTLELPTARSASNPETCLVFLTVQ